MAVMLIRSFRSPHRSHASDWGQSMVELALFLPILLIVALGATDLARGYYADVQVREAAFKGATYGAASTTQAADSAGIRTAALDGGTLIASPTVTSSTAADTSGGTAVAVTVRSSFSTLVPWPGVPNHLTVRHTTTAKVLQ
ncbi:MAG: pilus assembly protein [Chloroflexota bacterium]|nr:pilus assembly protein [Chloroflexota bacterium]